MDRFKFRVWNKRDKCFVNPLICTINSNGDLHLIGGIEFNQENHCIIEQCTGFKDKNGKLIYEGDILNSKNDGRDGHDVWDYTTHHSITIDHRDSYFDCDYEDKKSVFHESYIEIIGNIHEGIKNG